VPGDGTGRDAGVGGLVDWWNGLGSHSAGVRTYLMGVANSHTASPCPLACGIFISSPTGPPVHLTTHSTVKTLSLICKNFFKKLSKKPHKVAILTPNFS